ITQMQAQGKAELYERPADLKSSIVGEVCVTISDQDLGTISEEVIDNAFKFSTVGSLVEVTGTIEDDMYMVQVKNHGRGMTQAQIEAVGAYMQFNRFFYEQQGNGLGLIIAKRLIELYGGALKITSLVDKETIITLKAPIHK